MTHSKAFSRREALFLIGAGVAAVIITVGQPAEAKRRGSRGGGSSKPAIEPQPQPPSQIPSSGGTIRRNRVRNNIYPTAPVAVPQPLPAATLPGTCDAVRHPICNIVADDEGFSLWPVLIFGILGGVGWMVNKLLNKLKEIIVTFTNSIKGAGAKKQRGNTSKIVKDAEAAYRKKSSPKPKKPKKSQPPADPIEVELNQMSAELGATAMRSVRKPPDADKPPQWYVFRSGNTEGPYTKEQLREVQRITARTSVKREGQQDWVKAGTVEELASFLVT